MSICAFSPRTVAPCTRDSYSSTGKGQSLRAKDVVAERLSSGFALSQVSFTGAARPVAWEDRFVMGLIPVFLIPESYRSSVGWAICPLGPRCESFEVSLSRYMKRRVNFGNACVCSDSEFSGI